VQDASSQLNSLTSNHSLTMHLPVHLPKLLVDPKRIAQVLVNLVRNASSYAPEGSEISLSAAIRGTFVQVNVSDQGPGIPPAEHKVVFKAFRRGESVENNAAQGAGLGLAICKGLIEAHGGRIWIKKKSTPGATISFTLPLVPQDFSMKSLDGEE
jgi:two-component system sensor histidine kinase KdpD